MNLLDPSNLPFAAALGLMVVLGVMQVLGLAHALDGHDIDADHGDGAPDGLLSLLGIGRVPFLIWLALFLVLFAAVGLSIQQLAASLTGAPLDPLLAAALAGVAGLPLTGLLARPLGAVLPGDETTAVSRDTLLGRRARIIEGTARAGFPARAQVIDCHGQAHQVMVEPHDHDTELPAGDELLLVRREGEAFFATALTNRALSPD